MIFSLTFPEKLLKPGSEIIQPGFKVGKHFSFIAGFQQCMPQARISVRVILFKVVQVVEFCHGSIKNRSDIDTTTSGGQ